MALRTLGSKIRTFDLRVAKPAPKRSDDELQTTAHRTWRDLVLSRAAYRCEHVDEAGRRCERSRANGDRMYADHIVERADGGALTDLANGRCLCNSHNTGKGIAARAARR